MTLSTSPQSMLRLYRFCGQKRNCILTFKKNEEEQNILSSLKLTLKVFAIKEVSNFINILRILISGQYRSGEYTKSENKISNSKLGKWP